MDQIKKQIVNIIKSVERYDKYSSDFIKNYKTEKNKQTLCYIINSIELVLMSEKTNTEQKFNGLQLLVDFIKAKQSDLIRQLPKSDLYKHLKKYAAHKPKDKSEDRGFDLFGKQDVGGYSTQSHILILEIIEHLATSYPVDQNNQPTEFQNSYQQLLQMGVTFPQERMFIIKKVTKQMTVNQLRISSTKFTDEQLLDYHQQVYSNLELIQTIISQDQFDQQFVQDMETTLYQNYVQIEEALSQTDGLTAKVVQKVQQDYQFMKTHKQSFQRLADSKVRQKMVQDINDYLSGKTPGNHYEQPQFSAVQMNQQEQQQPFGQQFQKVESNFSSNKNQFDNDNYNFDNKFNFGDQSQVEDTSIRKTQQMDENINQFMQFDQNNTNTYPYSNTNQDRNSQFNQDRNSQFNQFIKDNKNSNFDQFDQNRNSQQQNQNRNSQQSQNRNSKQNRDSNVTFNGTQTKYNERMKSSNNSMNKLNPIIEVHRDPQTPIKHNNNFNNEFNEKFSQISKSATSMRGFPQKQDLKNPIKQNYGIQISIQDNELELPNLKPSDRNMRRFKISCLKEKSALFEVSYLQIGVKSGIFYDVQSSKNYLKLDLYFGNKMDYKLSYFQVDYDGDENVLMWTKPSILADEIGGKEQLKQELIINYQTIPFNIISMSISFNLQSGEQAEMVVNLPMFLNKFMNFKLIDRDVFDYKWGLKEDKAYYAEIDSINPKIIRYPKQFVEKYLTKMIELTDLDEFLAQSRYCEYRLGGMFELNQSGVEYLIKFILRPDQSLIIQIVSSILQPVVAQELVSNFAFLFNKDFM